MFDLPDAFLSVLLRFNNSAQILSWTAPDDITLWVVAVSSACLINSTGITGFPAFNPLQVDHPGLLCAPIAGIYTVLIPIQKGTVLYCGSAGVTDVGLFYTNGIQTS